MSDERTVRVYDPDTGLTTTIPARELAPGMVPTRVDGTEGEVWVPATHLKKGEYRHPEMPQYRPLFRRLSETFAEVHPTTPEEWEDDFRRDRNADKEMGLWVRIADAYAHFSERIQSPDGQLDLYQFLLSCVNNGRELALATVNLRALSRKRTEEVADYLCRTLTDEEWNELKERFAWGK
jgi:hypothetical protein